MLDTPGQIENGEPTKTQTNRHTAQNPGHRTQDTGHRTGQKTDLEKDYEFEDAPDIHISTIAETLGIRIDPSTEEEVESSSSLEIVSRTPSGDRDPLEDDDYSLLGETLDEAHESDEYKDTRATLEILRAEIRQMRRDNANIYNIEKMDIYFRWARGVREKTDHIYSI